MLSNQDLHEKILYPVVRVRSGQGGGSGVLVHSAEDPDNPGEFIYVALTCQHVVDSSIKMRDEWDPVLKRQRKTDYFEEVIIEVFDYQNSRLVSSNATQADIIAYDKYHDLAAVKLHNPHKMNYIADVISKSDIKDLRLFDDVTTCGCSLLHDPFGNHGTVTSLREVIEQKAYIMANAAAIFGNSGGGLFSSNNGNLLGLTSRVTVTQLGFGMDVQTWMNFSTHPDRLYEFFDHQELQFIADPNDSYGAAKERRERRRKDALRDMLWTPKEEGGMAEEAPTGDPAGDSTPPPPESL